MIRFLFGRPGYGKTYTMIREIASLIQNGHQRIFLIVPEQQAFSSERDVLSELPAKAGRWLSVLSFSRLCDSVADLYGGRTTATVTRSMKSLLMWENLREISGMLETYTGSSSMDSSLTQKILSTVEDLKNNGVSSATLERAAEHLDESSPLRGKLRDLALVSATYEGLLTQVYGENPADRLALTADQIEKHGFFQNTMVFIDSFTSFTAQEYAILRLILKQASNVTISFGCSSRYPTEPQFESIKDTIHRLTQSCEDLGVEFEDVYLTKSHRTNSPELSVLEKELWSFDLTPEQRIIPPVDQRGSIQTILCSSPYDEALAATLHILELVNQGVAYSEIAVVVRDTAAWEGILDATFEQYHIPFFFSQRTSLSEKPAVRLILSALRCISRKWQIDDIMMLCKTGLLGIHSRELDSFAEYVDTWKLSSKRMLDTAWSMNPDGYTVDISHRAQAILQDANRVRETVMAPLVELEDQIRTAGTVTEQCRALYDYLCKLDIKRRLSLQAEEYLSLGQVREAGEQVRIWSFLVETLATISAVMQEATPLKPDELFTALSLVFADTNIGSVPAQHDCVTIGSAATLRVDHIKAMLVLGLCEGEFPQATRDDGLLTEQDKETLADLGLELDSRSARLVSDELLYVWRTFSKPSDKLILSFSGATADGQTRAPSSAFTRVKYLFPYVEIQNFSAAMVGFMDHQKHRTPTDDTISRPLARQLLGDEIWLSQSRLQTYARCPYSYYGAHILRLRERCEAKFDNLGAGVFLHHVLEQYLRLALDEQNHIRPLDDDESKELAEAVITAYIEELCGDISENGRLLHIFDRLKQITHVLIDSIQAELRQTSFQVAGLEWDTHGRKTGDPRPMVLSLDMEDPDQVHSLLPTNKDTQEDLVRLLLGGRIDRVDFYRSEDGETVYVRVIDYKSSKHEFSSKSIAKDMNIQLLLYLFTLCSPENRSLFADANGQLPKQVLPASAVYISPDESDREGAILPCRTGIVLDEAEILDAANRDTVISYLPSVKRNKDGEFAGKGLHSSEQMMELEVLLKSTIQNTASTMYSGCASRTPSEDACKYCRMKESCGVCYTK
jgi:ATP-dependent helicase/nuclease subunit B